MKLNQNYANLQESYLFLTIAKKVAAYTEAHPDNHIIRMGIGDVTQPLVPAVIEAMHKATDEMAHKETFHGYSPDQGYDFLREAIQGYYAKRGVALKLSEIFVGDGAKTDVGNIVDIFADDTTVLIPDPVYPVYVDTNVMSGRKVIYLDANEQNGFLGMPDENVKADIIYLCSPNNPTGAVYNRAQLKAWVDYALKNNAVILFDAAYAPSSSARSRRPQASPVCAAAIPLSAMSLFRTAPRSIRCGRAVRPQSSTASTTSPSAPPRPSSRTKASSR